MSSEKTSDGGSDINATVGITLLTLRKPTELKKVIDSIPKPRAAVPQNGLPLWYKLGLECKLPVPTMPKGKIVFSRGKVGEDVLRIGLGKGGPRPTFDLTDPYCNNVSYDYIPMHDPHLAHHFAQKPARNRMKTLGFITKDGRAVCSLKEFNQYRKYLYNRFMDRIHVEIKRLDEKARDDLTLKRVEEDVARRQALFTKAERAREHLMKVARDNADDWKERHRKARAQEKKLQQRIKYLTEYNERQRKERVARAHEKQNRIKQRITAAAEMELRRKIIMIRQWRKNEKKRLNRLKQDKEAALRRKEDEADRKWNCRVRAQNMKIQEEACLLKLYSEDVEASAKRRAKKAQMHAYNTDLELQRIRLSNWKMMHGAQIKAQKLIKTMGREFEKSKRGAKGMNMEMAQRLAADAMASAVATEGDALMTLGQARIRMDSNIVLPPAPVKLLEEMLEGTIMEFTRRRISVVLQDVARVIYSKSEGAFFQSLRPTAPKRRRKPGRWKKISKDITAQMGNASSPTIAFGETIAITDEETTTLDMKSVKDRPPTPVPSKTKLAEVTFSDRLEDLPDPVTFGSLMPERMRLLETVSYTGRLLQKAAHVKVNEGMDTLLGKVVIPSMRHPMEWGEAVECLAEGVVNNRIHTDCVEVRQVGTFLAIKILKDLYHDMKMEKKRLKELASPTTAEIQEEAKDFYNPENVNDAVPPADAVPPLQESVPSPDRK